MIKHFVVKVSIVALRSDRCVCVCLTIKNHI